MGWLFTYDLSRNELIQDRIRPVTSEDGKTTWTCLKHSTRGNVLWTVWEIAREDRRERFIGCDILAKRRDTGWGYKDMSEDMGPCYHSCPLSYLEMVPVANEGWRAKVREYHARRNQKPAVGETWSLIGSRIKEVEIVSTRPLRGVAGYVRYRIPKRMLGEKLAAPVA